VCVWCGCVVCVCVVCVCVRLPFVHFVLGTPDRCAHLEGGKSEIIICYS